MSGMTANTAATIQKQRMGMGRTWSSRPAPSDLYPSVSLLLKISQPSQTAPPSGDQEFKL